MKHHVAVGSGKAPNGSRTESSNLAIKLAEQGSILRGRNAKIKTPSASVSTMDRSLISPAFTSSTAARFSNQPNNCLVVDTNFRSQSREESQRSENCTSDGVSGRVAALTNRALILPITFSIGSHHQTVGSNTLAHLPASILQTLSVVAKRSTGDTTRDLQTNRRVRQLRRHKSPTIQPIATLLPNRTYPFCVV